MATAEVALRKLQSNQPLTDAEKKLLGISVTKPKTKAPTSGVVSNFTPSVTMPAPARQPGQAGFVGPVAPAASAAPATPAAPVVLNTPTQETGPLGGLGAGVVAGVTAPSGYTPTGQPITSPVTPVKPLDNTYKPLREDIDAFEELGLILKSYGLEGLADTYGRLMTMGKTAGQALTILKYDKTVDPVTGLPYNAAYSKRFAGNAARVAGGMNAYDEGTYLQVENAYQETLSRYGLNNMISPDAATNQAKYADYMAKGIAPTEFASRIQTVADNVINADIGTKSQFKEFFPSITDNDLVAYFLNPKETLPILETKVRAAQIGAAATSQKLDTNRDTATALAQFGVTQEQARRGFSDIAEILPTATKLGEIYGDQYTQATAEGEVFQGLASSKRKREELARREAAAFSGSSGRLRTGRPQGNTGQF